MEKKWKKRDMKKADNIRVVWEGLDTGGCRLGARVWCRLFAIYNPSSYPARENLSRHSHWQECGKVGLSSCFGSNINVSDISRAHQHISWLGLTRS